ASDDGAPLRGAGGAAGPAEVDRERVRARDDATDAAVTQQLLDVLGVERPGELAIHPTGFALGKGRPVDDDRHLRRVFADIADVGERDLTGLDEGGGGALRGGARVPVAGWVAVGVEGGADGLGRETVELTRENGAPTERAR